MSEAGLAWDFDRQGRAVPPELRATKVVIVGCGTTGSWTLQILAREGFGDIVVYDGDTAETVNMPGQALAGAVGRAKVRGAVAWLGAAGFGGGVRPIARHFEAALDAPALRGATVFACVDTVEARADVALAAEIAGAELIDIRMGAEDGSVLYVPPMSWEAYRASLAPAGGFVEEPTCGARALPSTVFALVAHAVGRWTAAKREGSVLPRRVEINVAAGLVHDLA